jgi:hypothetical protein
MSEYGFTLSGAGLPEGEDPLGLWHVPPSRGVAFSQVAALPDEPTWRIELPESPERAQAILASQIQATERTHEDLARVNQELTGIDRTERVSFSMPDGTPDPLLAQKTELWDALDAFQSPVSYSLFDRKDTKRKNEESHRQWLAFVERVQQIVANYARIETTLDDFDVGLTTVGWTGDFETTWQPGVTIEMMHTHRQSVHLVLSSRIAWIRIVSVVATGAAGLAVKAAVPGGQVLLIPAVWKFVRDVLAELRKSWPKISQGDF